MADLQQALPTQYPDMSSMWQYAPAAAATLSGQAARFADQNNVSLQDAFQAQEQRKTQAFPNEQARLQAETGHLNAESGLLGQQTAAAKLGNQFTSQTQPGKVSATNAENVQKLSDADLKTTENFGQKLGMAAAAAKTEDTPWAQVNRASQILEQEIKSEPGLRNYLMNQAHSGNLPQALQELSDGIYKSTSAYRTKQMEEQTKLSVADKHAAASNYAADQATARNTADINAGRFTKNTAAYQLDKALYSGSLDQQLAAVQEMARQTEEPTERAYWLQRGDALQKMILQKAAAAASERASVTVNPNPLVGQPSPQGPNAPPIPVPPGGGASSPTPTPTPQQPGQKLLGTSAENWIQRAMQANHMTREQVIEQGKRLGKL